MTVSFEDISNTLIRRLERLDTAFSRYFIFKENKRIIEQYSFQEGLISSLWQSWGFFCKEILFGSIKGGITLSGQSITCPQYANLTELQLFYVAKILASNQNLTQIKSAKPQNEPTWGDVDKLGLLFTSFNTPNSQHVSVAVSGSALLKDLQLVRNANAHITPHTISSLKAAKVRYSDTRLRHPSDVMFWTEPSTHDFLWTSWVEEMKLLSSVMIE